jgi:CheY-like chemotaxis protein
MAENLKVLVVEDNVLNQKITLKTLENAGIIADLAINGKIAFEMFTQKQYDLVLMDIQMPIMDGLESTKLMREFETQYKRESQSIIIAVTANVSEDDVVDYKHIGMNEVISKPISRNVFLATIEKFFN